MESKGKTNLLGTRDGLVTNADELAYLKNYDWLDSPLNIEYLDKPKPIESLPFKQVWVIDNYLTNPIWTSWRDWREGITTWGRSNKVFRNGEYQHIYWGEGIYINMRESGGLKHTYRKHTPYAEYNFNNKRFRTSSWKNDVAARHQEGYRVPMIDWFIYKIRQDFRFNWDYFQYCGFNGQTIGQDGTVHEDTSLSEVALTNLSFLYYEFVNLKICKVLKISFLQNLRNPNGLNEIWKALENRFLRFFKNPNGQNKFLTDLKTSFFTKSSSLNWADKI